MVVCVRVSDGRVRCTCVCVMVVCVRVSDGSVCMCDGRVRVCVMVVCVNVNHCTCTASTTKHINAQLLFGLQKLAKLAATIGYNWFKQVMANSSMWWRNVNI